MFTTKILKNSLYCCLSLVLLGALGACHPEDPDANLQVIHLSPDAPSMKINDDNLLFTDGLGYASVTRLVDLMSGSHDVTFRGNLPDGSTPTLFRLDNRDFAETTNTIVVAVNTYDSIEPYVFVQKRDAIDSASARVRIVHLAPGMGMIDIYVTAPDADLLDSAALTMLDFKEELSETTLVAEEQQIRITAAGSQTVLFDSGTLNIRGGGDITILVSDNTANGNSPFELLCVVGSTGCEVGSAPRILIRDQNTPSEVRLIHASPTAGNLDVAIIDNASTIEDEITSPLLTDFSYGNATPYLEFVPDIYNIRAVSVATTTPILAEASATFAFAASQSVLLLDTETQNADLVTTTIDTQALLLSRDQRRVTTEAKLEIIHAALNADTVDVYLTTPGTDITSTDPVVTPLVSNLTANLSANPSPRTPGNYDLIITEVGNSANVLTSALNIPLVGGGIYTAIIIDDLITDANPDGIPASLLLLDDF